LAVSFSHAGRVGPTIAAWPGGAAREQVALPVPACVKNGSAPMFAWVLFFLVPRVGALALQ